MLDPILLQYEQLYALHIITQMEPLYKILH